MGAVMIRPVLSEMRQTPQRVLRLGLVTILLVGFGVRAWTLDLQSLWSDEGISLNRALLPLRELFAAMPVEHAPGYFVALHGWIGLAGTSDYALRYFSLWPGVLSVALIYRVATELAAPAPEKSWIGALAAAIAASSAFHTWYAQEARMYTWILAAGLVATWALWRLLNRGQGWGWSAALYATSCAVAVYLHYYAALLPLSHALYMVGRLAVTRRRGEFLRWSAAACAAFVLFLPWLPRALGVLHFTGWREGGTAAEIPMRYLTAYSVGDAMPEQLRAWLPLLYAGLAILGLILWMRTRPDAAWLLLTLLLLPVLVVLAMALRNPDFHERYTIGVAAPLAMLSAAGTVALAPAAWRSGSRRGLAAWGVPAFVGLLLIGSNGSALARQATDSTLHKPDFRAAAQRIQAQERPGDLVLVDGPNPELVFTHYYGGAAPVVDLRGMESAPADEVAPRLSAQTAGFARAWELLFFHEPAAVQVWLATQAWATEPSYHNNIRVTLYGLPSALPDRHIPHQLDVGIALRLEDSSVAPQRARAGEIVRVTTNWYTLSAPPDYKFSLRLSDQRGTPVLIQDYVPQNWFAPTTVWAIERPARDKRGIYIPATLAAGRYGVTLRVYDAASGAAVETASGSDIPLATVEVTP